MKIAKSFKSVSDALLFFAFVVVFTFAWPQANAGSKKWIKKGRQEAKFCVGCHGPKGKSVHELWPNLYGQNADYIVSQLKSFSSGERFDPLMTPIAKTLNDKEMKSLGAYYESFQKKK